MELTVLGSGVALPRADLDAAGGVRGRGASGYLLREGDACLFLDFGPGTTRRLPEHGLGLGRVTHLALTHLHVDHCGDLPALFFARTLGDFPPLTLHGPVGLVEHVRGIERLYGAGCVEPSEQRRVEEFHLEAGVARREIGPFALEVREMRHSLRSGEPGALGYRIESKEGGRLVFSGDSGPCSALVELARGADLALFECSYPATRASSSHLTTRTVAEMAIAAGVRALVLTHLYPEAIELGEEEVARQVRAHGYDGPLHFARDGAAFAVRPGGRSDEPVATVS